MQERPQSVKTVSSSVPTTQEGIANMMIINENGVVGQHSKKSERSPKRGLFHGFRSGRGRGSTSASGKSVDSNGGGSTVSTSAAARRRTPSISEHKGASFRSASPPSTPSSRRTASPPPSSPRVPASPRVVGRAISPKTVSPERTPSPTRRYKSPNSRSRSNVSRRDSPARMAVTVEDAGADDGAIECVSPVAQFRRPRPSGGGTRGSSNEQSSSPWRGRGRFNGGINTGLGPSAPLVERAASPANGRPAVAETAPRQAIASPISVPAPVVSNTPTWQERQMEEQQRIALEAERVAELSRRIRDEVGEKDGFVRRVDRYDGQVVHCDGRPEYELGNYLGGGVAGVVYEGTRVNPRPPPNNLWREFKRSESLDCDDATLECGSTVTEMIGSDALSVKDKDNGNRHLEDWEQTMAVKILNPVGFRVLPSSSIQSAIVLQTGEPVKDSVLSGKMPMELKHVWWVINPSSKNLRHLQRQSSSELNYEGSTTGSISQIDRGAPERGINLNLVAAFRDTRDGKLRELPLHRCIEAWGLAPFGASEAEFEEMMDAIDRVNSGARARVPVTPSSDPATLRSGLYRAAAALRRVVHCKELNAHITVPAVPPKYLKWLRQRRAATKEIRHMMRIGKHANVVTLYEVLELVQDTKSTMFLVLELVRGGELFDLISGSGSHAGREEGGDTEGMMKDYFKQLVSGIAYCHANGVAHRDLKPENLLVSDCGPGGEGGILKIADFGLSAVFGQMEPSRTHRDFPSILSNGSDSTMGTMATMGTLVTVGTAMSPFPQDVARFHRGGGSRTPSSRFSPRVIDTGANADDNMTGLSPLAGGRDNGPLSLTNKLAGQAKALSASYFSLLNCGTDRTTLDTGSGAAVTAVGQTPSSRNLRRMTSVVGSPHYVAPEITQQALSSYDDEKEGYDGTKSDVWSAGVILYAMLFKSLPFGEDLLRCPRFSSFLKWYDTSRANLLEQSGNVQGSSKNMMEVNETMLGPSWFFPSESSVESRHLIVAMLNPDPVERPSIGEVELHAWIYEPPVLEEPVITNNEFDDRHSRFLMALTSCGAPVTCAART
eukprot:CAMPEP_0194279516 /NCGR_PEP_ID=MMETSP0169-20130528/13972_1 /TAXON_ID=218684 /ORGANISM="Corethron pennatum, Strain L29A3" /LENGTH=1061 /DNA_ID=CAMNT_0039023951 /DNA_START=360 /DNA_END=3545 /DNA_ORIENTATION=-